MPESQVGREVGGGGQRQTQAEGKAQTKKRHGPIENVPHDLVQIDVIQKSIKQRATVR